MEDAHVVCDEIDINGSSCAIYAVYDGHGGARVANYAQTHLHTLIIKDPAFCEGSIETAIKNGHEKTEKQILAKANEEKWKDGSTSCLGIIYNNKFWMSNLGDSEAVLGRKQGKDNYEAILLTEKHVPTTASEKTRIEGMGGFIFRGRVFGTLAVSRALGDISLKNPDYVSAEPAIKMIELTNDDHFIILACDGLWDKVTYQEAVDFVYKVRKNGKSAEEISKAMVKEALERNSLDNITVVVVFLKWAI